VALKKKEKNFFPDVTSLIYSLSFSNVCLSYLAYVHYMPCLHATKTQWPSLRENGGGLVDLVSHTLSQMKASTVGPFLDTLLICPAYHLSLI
jgi:hypothetical protein